MPGITEKEAAHLLRRLGFNGAPNDIAALLGTKRDKAIDRLVNFGKIDNSLLEGRLRQDFPFYTAKSEAPLNDTNFNETEIRQWWLERMLLTARPLEEKLTLFWHNFFATSLDKVPVVHMFAQNQTLRQFATARFDDLLLQVAQGPAMLIYLDGVVSTDKEPNENFGRELQELFSMSPFDVVTGEANYTEQDVKEIARAFTGWRFRKSADPSPFAYEWFLDTAQADSRSKTIYGQTANFSGQDVITVIASRRATARFLVKRLFEFFVYPLDLNSAADRATIEKFADLYFANDHSIRELVRAIFKSPEFFSERAFFGLIKNPVEFVVGTMRMLGATFQFGSPEARNLDLERTLRSMGMDLLKPPNVFGWRLNLGFVTNDAMLERYNFADLVIGGSARTSSTQPGLVAPNFFNSVKASVKKTLTASLVPFGSLEFAPEVIDRLQTYLLADPNGNPAPWTTNRILGLFKVINFTRLVICLPEFQLN